MTNTDRLSAKINDSGLKLNYIAKELGITANSLHNKLTGYTEFKISEIKKLRTLLNISNLKEFENIFLM